MAKMKAIEAAVWVMEKEGITQAFGVPGAAINPLYAALRKQGSIGHILARHVEGASHMAEGYTRAGRQHRRVHRHLAARPAPT
jgi:tartronate-semialdehyde synthase